MKELLKILIVTCNQHHQKRITRLLHEADVSFEVDWINNYPDAVKRLEENGHDLVLLDYRLDGKTTTKLLRPLDCNDERSMPIVVIANEAEELDDLEIIRLGAADYLNKEDITSPLLNRSVRYAIERKKVEHRLLALSNYDPLTGLANRNLFYIKLADAIIQSLRITKTVALLLLDLDRFKEINDTYGHPAGDQLLKQVASRLREATRSSDTVARLGGDEFAIIASHFRDVTDIVLLLKKLIACFNEPYLLDGNSIIANTSIGAAICPTHSYDPDELMRHADIALYQAKAHGRNNFKFYNSVLVQRELENPVV